MFLKEFGSTQLQRETDSIFKNAYRNPIRITRQNQKGVVMMSEKEYIRLINNQK